MYLMVKKFLIHNKIPQYSSEQPEDFQSQLLVCILLIDSKFLDLIGQECNQQGSNVHLFFV